MQEVEISDISLLPEEIAVIENKTNRLYILGQTTYDNGLTGTKQTPYWTHFCKFYSIHDLDSTGDAFPDLACRKGNDIDAQTQ